MRSNPEKNAWYYRHLKTPEDVWSLGVPVWRWRVETKGKGLSALTLVVDEDGYKDDYSYPMMKLLLAIHAVEQRTPSVVAQTHTIQHGIGLREYPENLYVVRLTGPTRWVDAVLAELFRCILHSFALTPLDVSVNVTLHPVASWRARDIHWAGLDVTAPLGEVLSQRDDVKALLYLDARRRGWPVRFFNRSIGPQCEVA